MEACRAELTYTARTISAGETWVADRGGDIEGFFDVRFEGAIAEVYAMFVEQDVKRAGTGRALWRKIEDIAEAVDAAEIGLDADPFAVAFYLAMGCEVVGESPSASIQGRMLPRMVKRLHGA
jgi:GNAT superfamily N-acetyltransferase